MLRGPVDGGGIRGLSELLILEEIMQRIKATEQLPDIPRPCEYFDLIGGTSTGGLIAILLGRLCMSVADAISVYNEFAEKVFSETKYVWQDGTFKASAFEAAVKEIVARYDGDENALMMNDASNSKACKIFVCAMPASNMSHPRLFRSYEVHSNRSYNPTIWEAARATSAAPRFFKRIEIGTSPREEFIDSGLQCNNPTAEVLEEAHRLFGFDCPVACIVSLGAGHPKAIALRRPDALQRLLPTELVRVLVSIATDCEKISEDFERTHGENVTKEGRKYFRFSVQQGLQDVSLAEWTKMSEVKTHTLQYLRGAVVGREIDVVRDLLRLRATLVDQHRSQGREVTDAPSDTQGVLHESLLARKRDKVTASLNAIFDTTTRYRSLLACSEHDAQKVLDTFQTMLDTKSFQGRKQMIAAMRRLSARTNLYPARFFLKEPPKTLGDEPVAAGGSADVYRIDFQGEEMCFKVIRQYVQTQVEHMVKVYAKEAVLWAQLSHPNILPFYGLARIRSRLAFVSRWAMNGNLQEYLSQNPGANRLLLCADTAAGMEYLHQNDIVHGDLKGLNVLIDSSGRAALGDFGLSSVTDPQILKWTTQSTIASKGGTVRWQAPELLAEQDDSKIQNTKESDVYAWASVCYEVNACQPVFSSAFNSQPDLHRTSPVLRDL
ncbi:hypothetical protein C0993_007013 [Termitomyces sp. T159_Od127]|nr:hypothetical protein C0993_007013 [Termitomyces sp. T159_Od127]